MYNMLSLRCTMWWCCTPYIDLHISVITAIVLVNIIMTTYNCHFSLWWENLRGTSLATFEHIMILLITVTVQYIIYPELIHLITRSLYTWPTSPHFPCHLVSDKYHSILCFYELHFFRFHILVRSSINSVYLCLTYFTQHNTLKVHIHAVTNVRISFLLWLNNIPVCVCVSVSVCLSVSLFFIHSSIYKQLGLLPYLGFCE